MRYQNLTASSLLLASMAYFPTLSMAKPINDLTQPTASVASCDMNQTLRVATFNVSMEANNYLGLADGQASAKASPAALKNALASGDNVQITNVAEVIRRVNPDIILLNEFDYIQDAKNGVERFIQHYLSSNKAHLTKVNFPYYFIGPVNTGTPTPFFHSPLSRLPTFGHGSFSGQYGMAVLSKFPIKHNAVRTFQTFKWKDMPQHLMPIDPETKQAWYSKEETEVMRLSSKSHWDIPITFCGQTVHVLASHPTPPVFDGEEDRNGRRNHDEIRLIANYLSNKTSAYIYDDNGRKGYSLNNEPFVVVGDLNANDKEGDAYPGAIDQLLKHEKINASFIPRSEGGKMARPDNGFSAFHTAAWGMRADYVLPSTDFRVIDGGVFWPSEDSEQAYIVSGRNASSDHRLVWLDLLLPAVTKPKE